MIGQKTRTLLLVASLSLAPILALAQPVRPEDVPEMMRVLIWFQVAGMIFVLVLAAMALYFASQREKRRQELIAQIVEKGAEIPSALLPRRPSRQREMSRGVWLLAWGLGIGIVLYIVTGDWSVAAWSLILLFLSAASFVNAAFFTPRPTGNGD